MVTPGVTFGFTTIAIVFDVAEAGNAQVKLDVILTLTRSPLAKVLLLYTAEFVPTFIPLTFH